MLTSVRRRTIPRLSDEPHPIAQLLALAALVLVVDTLAGTFAGIVVFVTGVAALAAHAAAHPMRPQRPSVRGASASGAEPARPAARARSRR
jgi:hypothetical protein